MRALSGARHSATKAVWAGEVGYLVEGATQVPIVQSIPFGYDDLDEWMAVATGEREGHIYSRNTNPTTRAFEEKVRALEGAEATTSFSTGMAAISNTLFAFLEPGKPRHLREGHLRRDEQGLPGVPTQGGRGGETLRHHGPRRRRRRGC